MKRLVRIDFVRFGMVGALGFVINFLLLTLLFRVLDLPIFVAQILAAEVALFHNFIWHHHWTYKANNVSKNIWTLVVQFHITSWVAVVGSAALISLFVHTFGLDYIIALVLSSAIAMFWNFGWTKFVIWRHKGEQPKEA